MYTKLRNIHKQRKVAKRVLAIITIIAFYYGFTYAACVAKGAPTSFGFICMVLGTIAGIVLAIVLLVFIVDWLWDVDNS